MFDIASSGGRAIIVRAIDYESQCCCGLPCVNWTRFASRDQLYAGSPPPSFPCCGLLESYSVTGNWTSGGGNLFRLTSPITVSAVLGTPGLWDGEGGTLQASSDGLDWYDWFEQPAIAAISFRGRDPEVPGRCRYQVSIGGGNTFRDSFFLSVGPRGGPIGQYTAFFPASVSVS